MGFGPFPLPREEALAVALPYTLLYTTRRGAASCDPQTWFPWVESQPQKSSSLFRATCDSVPSGEHQAGVGFGAHGTPAEPELPQTALIRLDLKPHRHGQQLEFCWDSEACTN